MTLVGARHDWHRWAKWAQTSALTPCNCKTVIARLSNGHSRAPTSRRPYAVRREHHRHRPQPILSEVHRPDRSASSSGHSTVRAVEALVVEPAAALPVDDHGGVGLGGSGEVVPRGDQYLN